MIGAHCVKGYSKTLPVIALSSGEAELGAVMRGTAEAKGMKTLLADLDMDVDLEVMSDATAAIGITNRLGLGKVRHLAVCDLWVQQTARNREVKYLRVDGSSNPSDILTKPVPQEVMHKHLIGISVHIKGGRAASAPDRLQTHDLQSTNGESATSARLRGDGQLDYGEDQWQLM